MTLRLRILPEAEEELQEAAQWYESKRPGLGVEFVATIDAHFEQILEAPGRHPLWRRDRPYRQCVVRRFPFVIFFLADKAEVTVVAVAHGKRRPGYWLDRKR